MAWMGPNDFNRSMKSILSREGRDLNQLKILNDRLENLIERLEKLLNQLKKYGIKNMNDPRIKKILYDINMTQTQINNDLKLELEYMIDIDRNIKIEEKELKEELSKKSKPLIGQLSKEEKEYYKIKKEISKLFSEERKPIKNSKDIIKKIKNVIKEDKNIYKNTGNFIKKSKNIFTKIYISSNKIIKSLMKGAKTGRKLFRIFR